MRKTISSIGSAALALLMFGTSITVAEAAPLNPAVPAIASSDVTPVDDPIIRRYGNRRDGDPAMHGQMRQWGDNDRRVWNRGDRNWRGGSYRNHGSWRRDEPMYYNGHRGYRDWRHGYRRHNGFWFPGAAFATGIIIGGALSAPREVRGLSRSHVQYCMNRYRSYRVSDDTYQPNSGPRRRCQ